MIVHMQTHMHAPPHPRRDSRVSIWRMCVRICTCARTATPQSRLNIWRIASGVSKKSFELPFAFLGAQHDVSSRHRGLRRRLTFALNAVHSSAASGTK